MAPITHTSRHTHRNEHLKMKQSLVAAMVVAIFNISYSNTSNREIFWLEGKFEKRFSLSFVARRSLAISYAFRSLYALLVLVLYILMRFSSLVFFWLSISHSFNSDHEHIDIDVSNSYITARRERDSNPNSKIFAPQKT